MIKKFFAFLILMTLTMTSFASSNGGFTLSADHPYFGEFQYLEDPTPRTITVILDAPTFTGTTSVIPMVKVSCSENDKTLFQVIVPAPATLTCSVKGDSNIDVKCTNCRNRNPFFITGQINTQ